jgi:nucleoside 2-deoxyribosyltransferase
MPSMRTEYGGSMKVYLAGPIEGLDYEGATGWRDQARAYLNRHGIRAFSPMRGKEYLKDEATIVGHYEYPLSTQKGLTSRDRYDTTTSDLVIVNLKGASRVSIGTMVELGWADASRVPVMLIMEQDSNLHDHAMVREIAAWRVDSLDEALHLVVSILTEGGEDGTAD